MGNHTATRARGRATVSSKESGAPKSGVALLKQRYAEAMHEYFAPAMRPARKGEDAAARLTRLKADHRALTAWMEAVHDTAPVWAVNAGFYMAQRLFAQIYPGAHVNSIPAASLARSDAPPAARTTAAKGGSKPKGGTKASGSTRAPTEETIIGPRQHWSGESDLRAATNQWAAKMSVKPTSIAFADLPGKWGTMDTAGHLTLSRSLLSLPPRLGEYVMVHELAHRLAPNHGIVFQAYLHAYMPDWQAREAALQKAGLSESGAPPAARTTAAKGGSKPKGGTKSGGGSKANVLSLDQRAAVALARESADRVRAINPQQATAARWVARWLSAHPITEPIPPSTPAPAQESARQRGARLYQNWQRPAEWIEATRGIRAADPNAYHHATAAATAQGMAAQREWLANTSPPRTGARARAKKSA